MKMKRRLIMVIKMLSEILNSFIKLLTTFIKETWIYREQMIKVSNISHSLVQ